MRFNIYRFIAYFLIIFWSSPTLALTTLHIDFNDMPAYCSIGNHKEIFWNDLDYLSDTITSQKDNLNEFRSFIYNGITVNMNGDMVYSAFPMKFRVNGETVVTTSQDRENTSTPIPEPTSILLLGSGILCAVGIGRKFRPNKRKNSEDQEGTGDYVEEINYCEYLLENEPENIVLAEEEKID